jgi:osmoprotectant transport system substrate-binding protein
MRRLLGLTLTLVTSLVLAACGGDEREPAGSADAAPDGRSDAPVRIGTKNFTEQYILGELYRQALESEGFRVELKRDIGSSEIVHQALAGGALDMYPEYVGVLLSEIADMPGRPRDARAAYAVAKSYEERRGFTLLEMTPFSDSNALAVTAETARRHRIESIDDLRRLPGAGVEVGAPPEFRTRFEGLRGLQRIYGMRDVAVTALRIGEQYDALDAGRVDVAAVFTTDGRLARRNYVVLEDPRGLFADQRVAPVIDRDALDAHGPELAEVIDSVSRRLTTPAMRRMNAEVDLRGAEPADVARRFLSAQSLL